MGRKAKIRKQRKLELAENIKATSPKSEPDWKHPEELHQVVKYWLTHQKTKNWIKSQWNLLIGDRPFISDHQQDILVSKLLKLCFNKFKEHYEFLEHADLTIKELDYDVAIWLDSDKWTISTGIRNNSTDEVFLLPEGREFQLSKIPPLNSDYSS